MRRRYSRRERLFGYGALWLSSQRTGEPDAVCAAKLTGFPVRTLRDWWKAGPPEGFEEGPALPSTTEPEAMPESSARAWAEALVALPPEQKQIERIAQLYEQRERLGERSPNAIATLTVQLARTIGEMLPKEGVLIEGPEGLPEDEYREWLRQQATEIDDIDIEVLMAAYAERHNGRVLFIGGGGHRAELDDDGRWKTGAGGA